MWTNNKRLISSAVPVALVALLIGCGQPSAGPLSPRRDPGLQVAVVPGADLLFRLDTAAMRKAPIIEAIKQRREADGKTAPGKMDQDQWTRIQALTGLTEDDFLSVLISADLDTLDLNNPKTHEEVNGAMGACAMELAKPLPFPKLLECLRIATSRASGVKVEQIELAGHPVARALPTGPKEPVIHAAVSRTEKTLLITFNAEAMERMLERDNARKAPATNPSLVELESRVDSDAQFQLLVLASEAMRERIRTKIDAMKDPNPQAKQTRTGMMMTFFSPVRNIRNLVLGVKAAEALDISLSGDLGNPSEAQQCAHLLQAFIVPMVSKGFEKVDPENKIRMDDSLHAGNEGSTLQFTMKITAQDVEYWQQPGARTPPPVAPTVSE